MKKLIFILCTLAAVAVGQFNFSDPGHRNVRTDYSMVFGATADEGTGTVSADLSGNGGLGNLLNGATWAAGKFGSSFSLDGVNDFVAITNAAIQKLNSQFSISTWVKLTTTNQAGKYVLDKRATGDEYAIVWNGTIATPRLTYEFYAENVTGAGNPRTSFLVQILDTSFHHLCVTYDGVTIRMFQDGVETTNRATAFTLDQTQAGILRIGTSSGGADFFNGQVDATRIYNRPLTPREVMWLFNYQ